MGPEELQPYFFLNPLNGEIVVTGLLTETEGTPLQVKYRIKLRRLTVIAFLQNLQYVQNCFTFFFWYIFMVHIVT